MGFVEKALKEKKKMTPETGYNLVGLETFGSPEEQGLYFISHFEEESEAEAEKTKREKEHPGEKYYVYSAK